MTNRGTMNQYKVIENYGNKRDFEKDVQRHLDNGWELNGAMAIAAPNFSKCYATYYQSLVRKTKEKPVNENPNE